MLNGIRGRLIAIRVEIDDFEKIILPRDPNSVRYLGGDITILSFLAAITALSAGILAKVLFYGDVPHFNRLPFSSCKTILAPLLAITIFVTLIMTWVSLSIKWEREWDHNYWPRYWPCCFEPVLKKIGFLKGDAQSTIHRGDPGWESP